jgi:hypothetical protein
MTEREQIIADVITFYNYWQDEMSSDAREWIDDILNMIRKPQFYGYLYEGQEND